MVACNPRNNCGGRTVECTAPRVPGWIRLQPGGHAGFMVVVSSYPFRFSRTVPNLAAVGNVAETMGSGREHYGARQRSDSGVAPHRSPRLEVCPRPVRMAQHRQDSFSFRPAPYFNLIIRRERRELSDRFYDQAAGRLV